MNLPEHATNPIHTDDGARAAGFDRALVAGVTTYAYLTRPPAAAWGLAWLRGGGAAVSFRRPVCEDDDLDLVPTDHGDHWQVDAAVDGDVRATATFVPSAPPPSPRPGDQLDDTELVMAGEFHRYGARCGEDLSIYDDEDIVHPGVWPSVANWVVHRQVREGSWIHTRSAITHLGTAPAGATLLVRARVVDRFPTRAGDRAVLDVEISHDGRRVAFVDHEAIVRLRS